MVKTGLFSERKQSHDQFEMCGVSSLSVANYGETIAFVIISNVQTPIPAFDKATMKAPPTFTIDGDGTLSDFKMEIDFENGTGDAILYYRKQIKS